MARLGSEKRPTLSQVQTEEKAMNASLLRTKLYIPPVPLDLVARPHLFQRLDDGLRHGHKLILLSAPAGFGKTTLLCAWAATLTCEVAWLSLDEDDNDPARFLAYLIGALQQAYPDIGPEIVEAFHASQALPAPPPGIQALQAWLASAINQIDALRGPLVLVLDDYHLIAAAEIHQALAYLLDHLPRNLHLALATRSDPPLPLARLRGRGQLTELRQSDLGFSAAEVGAFLQQIGQHLPPGDVAALADRTEGWGTALQIAALAVRGMDPTDASSFLASFSGRHEHIADYFADEVLARQSDPIQSFLLHTSILDRLTGSLCDALSGRQDGQQMLDQLAEDNLFLVPLDAERRWYRYHRLFADLLRQRLHRQHPALVPQLHHCAGEWYERHALIGPALAHAEQAADPERIADLLEAHAPALWGNGETAVLARGMAALSHKQFDARPKLCIYAALLALTSGQAGQAESLLHRAERAPGSPPDRAERQGMAAALRAYIAFVQGSVPAIVQHAQHALHCLPAHENVWRAGAAMALGDAQVSLGHVASAAAAYIQAIQAAQAGGNRYLARTADLKRLDALCLQGKLRQVAAECRQHLQGSPAGGADLLPLARTSTFRALLGSVLTEWNELDEALQHIQAGIELGRRNQHTIQLGWAYDFYLRALLARRDWTQMQKILYEIDRLAQADALPVWAANRLAAWRVRIWIAQAGSRPGDRNESLADADELLRERGIGEADAADYLRLQEHLALVRLRLAQGRPTDMTGLLNRLLLAAQVGSRQAHLIEILLLQALALHAQAYTGQALAVLDQALHIAEPEGFLRVFLDEGRPMARLLYLAAQKGIAPTYCGRLLDDFAQDQPPPAPPGEGSALIEPLSPRELEVLALIAKGLSNREIAAQLYISLSTVKGHTANIYGKLQVNSRTQAVARARTLGILPPSTP